MSDRHHRCRHRCCARSPLPSPPPVCPCPSSVVLINRDCRPSGGCVSSCGCQGPPGAQGAQGNPGTPGPQGIPGAQGVLGAQGAIGAQGNLGAQGSQGNSFSKTSMFADNTTGDVIDVPGSGNVLIHLPDDQILDGFIATATSTMFQVPTTGTYYFHATAFITAPTGGGPAITLTFNLFVNGSATFFLSEAVTLSETSTTTYSFILQGLVVLAAGQFVSIGFNQSTGSTLIITLAPGEGASLTLMRVS